MSASTTPAGRPLRCLSGLQREVIEWLAAGYKPDQVAVMVHVPPARITKWLRKDLMFRSVLTMRRADPRPSAVPELESMLHRLKAPEPEQGWASEQPEEDETPKEEGEDGRRPAEG